MTIIWVTDMTVSGMKFGCGWMFYMKIVYIGVA